MSAAAALPQRGAFRKARESLPTRPEDGNVKGTVDKVEWTNPHIWIYVDTKDESGTVTRWQCEGGKHADPARLEQGFTQTETAGEYWGVSRQEWQ